jgi:hypothetical protein
MAKSEEPELPDVDVQIKTRGPRPATRCNDADWSASLTTRYSPKILRTLLSNEIGLSVSVRFFVCLISRPSEELPKWSPISRRIRPFA